MPREGRLDTSKPVERSLSPRLNVPREQRREGPVRVWKFMEDETRATHRALLRLSLRAVTDESCVCLLIGAATCA